MKARKPIFVENFIGKYFMSMPLGVRVIVYLVLVLAFVHNYLKPSVLQGQLWITNESGINQPGEKYEVRHGASAFRVNSDGRWALTTDRKLPGTITVTIVDPNTCHIGDAALSLPLPVWSEIKPQQYSISGNVQQGFFVKETARIGADIPAVTYAQTQVSTRASNLVKKKSFVRIRGIQLKESGDSKGRTGELYFKVYLNGEKLEETGLPEKNYPNTHLLIDDNTTTAFTNLGFFLPDSVQNAPKSKLLIKIYDYDRFGKDDKIGEFKVILNSNTEFGKPKTYHTEELERHWSDNSSITIEFQSKQ